VTGNLPTIVQQDISVTVGAGVQVNTANVIAADISATNGVVHLIDEVLVPSTFVCPLFPITEVLTLIGETEIRTVVGLSTAVDGILSNPTSGPFTLFAPNNAAVTGLSQADLATFTANLDNNLLYHAISGAVLSTSLANDLVVPTAFTGTSIRINVYSNGVATVNGARIVETDYIASNGVVHVINEVLFPVNSSIADLAAATPDLSTLLSLVSAAGLAPVLVAPGNFTVFAPTNAAFTALETSCPGVTAFLSGNVSELAAVISYHVLGSTYYSAGLVTGNLPTIVQQDISVTVGAGVQINTANVVTADISATNGVVHLIDAVLVPPTFGFSCPSPTTATSASAASAATSAAISGAATSASAATATSAATSSPTSAPTSSTSPAFSTEDSASLFAAASILLFV